MPVFLSMLIALQRLPELFQNTLKTEGLLWFPNLGAPDPYFILPALTAGSFFLTIEASKKGVLATGAQGQTMLNVMRGIVVLMIPFTAYFPAVMFVYFPPINLFSLPSTLVLTRPFIKK
jgi:YidC/Oxa1 family membrane protein insertase